MNLKAFRLSLLFSSAITFLFACNHVDADKFVSYRYQQTQCADPWGTAADSDDIVSAHVAHYLDSMGIPPAGGISVTHDGQAELCNSCGCRTGRIIHASLLDGGNFDAKLQAIGFTKEP